MVFTSGYCIAKLKATRANSKADRLGVGKGKCRPAFGSTAQKTLAVPHRSYSLSRRASRPGCAGQTGRTSACRVTDFSSRHTTGSAGSYGFSYVSKTSSILAMYSSLSSATHHIFFPPRLEVVVQEQNPDRFPSHARDQAPLDGLLCYQTDRPAGAALRGIATHHRDNPLFLAVIEHRSSARPRSLEQRGFQTSALVTMANGANGLRSEWDDSGNPRRAGAFRQFQQRQGTQDDPHLLHTATQQLGEFFLVLWRDIDPQRWTAHTPSMRRNNST